MNDREGFISRWARRKREAAKGEGKPQEQTDVSAVDAADAPQFEGKAETATREGAVAMGVASDELTVDLSKLPSIESITAETDIRPFLARGVPSALRHAALRKMWVADPSIRDFIEVAENQWDFNAQGELLGFDLSPPVGDVRRMVAEIIGDRSRVEPEPKVAAEGTASTPIAAGSDADDATLPDDVISGDIASNGQTSVARPAALDTASQNDVATQQKQQLRLGRRPRGRAMPH